MTTRGKVEPEIAAVPQWDKIKGLTRVDFESLRSQRLEIKLKQRELQKALNSINNKFMGALMAVDVKSVGVGEAKVTLVPAGKTTKFDRNLCYARLLELGVKPVTVAKAYKDATTEGDREAYILVTDPEEKEE